MTTAEAIEVFNAAIKTQNDPDKAARIELAREFFTNPDFRKSLEDYVWQINQAKTR